MSENRRDFLAASVAALALPPAPLWAQQPWPSKPIKGINPFQAGGPSDFLGRLIGDKLAQRFGQTFIMENRPGAGGNVGIDALAKSPPDGHTLAWVVDFNVTVNPVLYPKMPYDVEKDIAPVMHVCLLRSGAGGASFGAGEVAGRVDCAGQGQAAGVCVGRQRLAGAHGGRNVQARTGPRIDDPHPLQRQRASLAEHRVR